MRQLFVIFEHVSLDWSEAHLWLALKQSWSFIIKDHTMVRGQGTTLCTGLTAISNNRSNMSVLGVGLVVLLVLTCIDNVHRHLQPQ